MSIPLTIIQEVRNLVAIHARELVMAGEDAARVGQAVMQGKVFHGSEGYESVLSQFMKASGHYAACFDRVPIENFMEGNSQRSEGFALELKPILHCDQGKYEADSTAALGHL